MEKIDLSNSKTEVELKQVYEHELTQNLISEVLGRKPNLNNIKLPYLVKDKVLFGTGNWNDIEFSYNETVKSYQNTDWLDAKVTSLYYDHIDDSMANWIGNIINPRLVGGNIVADLEIVDENAARKIIHNGGKFGISSKVSGDQTKEGALIDFVHNNFSLVTEPAASVAHLSKNPAQSKGVVINLVANDFNKINGGHTMTEDKTIKLSEKILAAVEKTAEGLDTLSKRVEKLEEAKAETEKTPDETEETTEKETTEEETTEETTEEETKDTSADKEEEKSAEENTELKKVHETLAKINKKLAVKDRKTVPTGDTTKVTKTLKEQVMELSAEERDKAFIALLAEKHGQSSFSEVLQK